MIKKVRKLHKLLVPQIFSTDTESGLWCNGF